MTMTAARSRRETTTGRLPGAWLSRLSAAHGALAERERFFREIHDTLATPARPAPFSPADTPSPSGD
jgi:hypothetical protein